MKILAAQKSTVLMIENGSNTLTTPAALDTMLIDLTLHQIRSQDLMAQLQLLEESDLRRTLKHHAVGLLNTDLSTKVKVENTIDLFTKADDLHSRASITSLEKIYKTGLSPESFIVIRLSPTSSRPEVSSRREGNFIVVIDN